MFLARNQEIGIRNKFLFSQSDLLRFLEIVEEHIDIDLTELSEKKDKISYKDILLKFDSLDSVLVNFNISVDLINKNLYDNIPMSKKGVLTRLLTLVEKKDLEKNHCLICNIFETSLRGNNIFLQIFL